MGFDQKGNLWTGDLKENSLRGYSGMMENFPYDQNMKYFQGKNNSEYNNLLNMKQANNKINSYLFENPNL